jgi:predicted RNase H-like HicB family nuclease
MRLAKMRRAAKSLFHLGGYDVFWAVGPAVGPDAATFSPGEEDRLVKMKITYWRERDGKYLGFLNDYPDHWTQGESYEDLVDHLRDLYQEFQVEDLPGIRKVEEIEIG